MSSLISKAFLYAGNDLKLFGDVAVRHPYVGDILRINDGLMCEDHYWAYISLLVSDPYDHMVYLDDNGVDYEAVTPFEVFVLRWNSAAKEYAENKKEYDAAGTSPLSIFRDALSFFFGDGHEFELVSVQGQVLIVDLTNPRWFLNKEAFLLASDFIKQMNCVMPGDRIKPATPFAKQILIEDARAELKKRMRNPKDDERPEQIGEAIAAVYACGAGCINPDNCDKTPVYALLAAANSIRRQMVVQSILNGIHVGMIKTDKISDKDLRWT